MEGLARTLITQPTALVSSWNRNNSSTYAYDALPADDIEQRPPLNDSDDQKDGYGWTWRDIVHRRPIMRALANFAFIFVACSLLVGGILWWAIPPVEEADKAALHIPKSFDELKELNTLLQKLKLHYPARTLICFVVTYFYLQAFSIPGSMYLSILAGAVWGVTAALPLVCTCVACGATLCYAVSSCFGPALFALPKFKARIDKVATRMCESGHRENIIPYLIVLRMAPLPPHWFLNLAAPHLGISIPTFWISTFLGVMGVSVIHTTIGGGLERMTSQDDFHLISWGNFFGLSAVIVAVCVGILVRWRWRKEITECDMSSPSGLRATDEERQMVELDQPAQGRSSASLDVRIRPQPIYADSVADDEDDYYDNYYGRAVVKVIHQREVVAPNGLGLSGMFGPPSAVSLVDQVGEEELTMLVPLPPRGRESSSSSPSSSSSTEEEDVTKKKWPRGPRFILGYGEV